MVQGMPPAGRLAVAALPVQDAESLQPLSQVVLQDLDHLTDRLTRTLLRQEPSYAELGDAALANLRSTLRANIEIGVRSLTRTLPNDVDPVAIAREAGRLRAMQGIPLEAVLRAYQLGGRAIWDALLSASRKHFSGRYDRALLDMVSIWWRSIDSSASALVDAYRLEETKLSSEKLSRRHAFLNALLEGRCADPSLVREAATVLGLPENGVLMCVVARVDSPHHTPLRSPHSVLAAHGIESAWHFRPTEVIGLVNLDGRSPAAVLDVLRPAVTGSAGASPAIEGLSNVSASYELARTAARTQHRPGLVTLDQRLPEALLISSPELATRLLPVAFGDLLAMPEQERTTLTGTLEALLSCNLSATHAAQRLYCHRNTVLYRQQRIEAVTRRSLSKPRHRLLFALGLLALRAQESSVDD